MSKDNFDQAWGALETPDALRFGLSDEEALELKEIARKMVLELGHDTAAIALRMDMDMENTATSGKGLQRRQFVFEELQRIRTTYREKKNEWWESNGWWVEEQKAKTKG